MDTFMRFRFIRILVLVRTTALSTSGCYKWATVSRPGELARRDKPLKLALVTDTLGHEYRVAGLQLADGGYRAEDPDDGAPIHLSEEEVAELQVRKMRKRRLIASGAMTTVMLVTGIMGLWPDPPHSDNCWFFSCE